MSRRPALHHAVALAVVLAVWGCADKGAPEHVADAFADAYFREMNQEKAKEFTALGASAMLDAELRDVAQVRKEGYGPGESRAEVIVRRGQPVQRDQRIRFPFEVIVRADGAETVRDADVELAHIQGTWKVVRVGLTSRP